MLGGPLCVECSSKVGKLYTEYSEGNIKLTRCVSSFVPLGVCCNSIDSGRIMDILLTTCIHRTNAGKWRTSTSNMSSFW